MKTLPPVTVPEIYVLSIAEDVNERNEVIGHAEEFVAVLWKLTRR